MEKSTHVRRYRFGMCARRQGGEKRGGKNGWKNKIVYGERWSATQRNNRDKRFYLSKQGNFQLAVRAFQVSLKFSRLYLLPPSPSIFFPVPFSRSRLFAPD